MWPISSGNLIALHSITMDNPINAWIFRCLLILLVVPLVKLNSIYVHITMTLTGCLAIDYLQESPLLVAAQNGHTKCVTLLLEKGSDMLQTNKDGRNCLMIAIQNHHKYGNCECYAVTFVFKYNDCIYYLMTELKMALIWTPRTKYNWNFLRCVHTNKCFVTS